LACDLLVLVDHVSDMPAETACDLPAEIPSELPDPDELDFATESDLPDDHDEPPFVP